MDNEKVVANWQQELIRKCESRLHRKLAQEEVSFIRSRGGFMALEFIADTVVSASTDELVAYLNSENELPPLGDE